MEKSFVSVSDYSGEGNQNVQVTVSENPMLENREDTLNVVSDSGIERTVRIVQESGVIMYPIMNIRGYKGVPYTEVYGEVKHYPTIKYRGKNLVDSIDISHFLGLGATLISVSIRVLMRKSFYHTHDIEINNDGSTYYLESMVEELYDKDSEGEWFLDEDWLYLGTDFSISMSDLIYEDYIKTSLDYYNEDGDMLTLFEWRLSRSNGTLLP